MRQQKRRRPGAWFALATLIAAFPPWLVAADFPRTTALVEEAIGEGLASATLAYSLDGKIVWERSWGFADRERGVEATPETMYSLASISKPFTTTGIMLLVQDERIDLSEVISKYIGETEKNIGHGRLGDVSIRQIANHTSGLPLHYQFFYRDEPRAVPPREETIRRYGVLVTPPGERVQYSNLGFGILDHVISEVSGLSYSEFLNQRLFGPLGLERCAVGVPEALKAHAAVRYGSDDEPIPFYDFDHPGASALYCSARDLLRFGHLHLGFDLGEDARILTRENLAEMQRRADPISNYGVGWGVRDDDGVLRVSHSGGMGGVATTLTLLPEHGAAFVVLLNSRGPLRAITETFLQEALPDHVEAPEESEGSPDVPKFRAPKELVGRWKGTVSTYGGEVPVELRIRRGGIRIRLGNSDSVSVRDLVLPEGDLLRGRFSGELPTEDVMRNDRTLALAVTPRGDLIDGSLIAFTQGTKNKIGNALTHWIELRRVK